MTSSPPPIPALGIAVYNRPDLLAKCVASIDHPVERLIIVNNGKLPELAKEAEFLAALGRQPGVGKVTVLQAQGNLGVAPAWNWLQDAVFMAHRRVGQLQAPGLAASSVIISGNDIEWAPGDLATFAATVENFPEADFVFGNHAYSNFLIKRSGWVKVGAFDENIEVGYMEDSDHWQRIRHTPGVKAIHAAGLNAKHEGSATINSDAAFKRKSGEQHAKNWVYYGAKWGCPVDSHAAETFTTPFNQGGDVNAWKLEGARLERPHFYTSNPVAR
jgi:GT2 family glycosyltransferase